MNKKVIALVWAIISTTLMADFIRAEVPSDQVPAEGEPQDEIEGKLELLLAGEDAIFWAKSSTYVDLDQTVHGNCQLNEAPIKDAFASNFSQKPGFEVVAENRMNVASAHIKITSIEMGENFCVAKFSVIYRFNVMANIPRSDDVVPGGLDSLVDYYWPVRFDLAMGDLDTTQRQVVDFAGRAGTTVQERVFTAIMNMFEKFPKFMERAVPQQ